MARNTFAIPGPCGVAQIYGDGQNLTLDFGGKSYQVKGALVESLEFTLDHGIRNNECCLRNGSRVFFPGPQSIAIEMRIVASALDQFDRPMPDLRELAKQLTVSELFGVINEKLNDRE